MVAHRRALGISISISIGFGFGFIPNRPSRPHHRGNPAPMPSPTRYAAILLIAVLLTPMAASAADGGREHWRAAAEMAESSLRQHFWDPVSHLFRNRADRAGDSDKQFNYWWQAHGLMVMAAAVKRGGTVWAAADLGAFRDGLLARNGRHWTNDYYDDEGWMACAMLDAGTATNDAAYHEVARLLWDDIRISWNDSCGGGIPWRKTQRDYKNAPANGPAMVIGASLFQAEHKADDLAMAVRIDDWLVKTLRDPKDGAIWDGINRTGKGDIDKNWRFTYVQGIFVGGSLALHRATREARYLADAERTGAAALDSYFPGPGGLCTDKGNGDGGLFKGILVQYLGQLAQASPALAGRIRSVLEANGRRLGQLQAEHAEALLPASWNDGAAPADVELSVELSGVLLDEALCELATKVPEARR
jgi:predicted alpha-1,6-mannanase (GH76 family)